MLSILSTKRSMVRLLKNHAETFAGIVFQGDLLFTPGNGARSVFDFEVSLRPNSVWYRVAHNHELYNSMKDAPLGFVMHTCAKIEFDRDTGVCSLSAWEDNDAIDTLSSHLSEHGMCAITPWRHNVPLCQSVPPNVEQEIFKYLARVTSYFENIGNEFRHNWSKDHLSRFRTFLNTFLNPPSDGGIFLEAKLDAQPNADKLIDGFLSWVGDRAHSKKKNSQYTEAYSAKLVDFVSKFRTDFQNLVMGFYAALRAQELLLPYLSNALASKLGGGESEGIMITKGPYQVKLVDRLGFTMANNLLHRNNPLSEKRIEESVDIVEEKQDVEFPAPFEMWKPATTFFICKLQPPHAGHIAAIKEAKNLSTNEFHVIASNKAPNLEATTWQELGVSDTLSDFRNRDYKYVLSLELRERILRISLGKDINISFLPTALLWAYIQDAKDKNLDGSIAIAVGAKEINSNRYDKRTEGIADKFSLLPVKMQEDGIDGSTIRKALRRFAIFNDPTARATLRKGLSAIADHSIREQLIDDMVNDWHVVDKIGQRLLPLPSKGR